MPLTIQEMSGYDVLNLTGARRSLDILIWTKLRMNGRAGWTCYCYTTCIVGNWVWNGPHPSFLSRSQDKCIIIFLSVSLSRFTFSRKKNAFAETLIAARKNIDRLLPELNAPWLEWCQMSNALLWACAKKMGTFIDKHFFFRRICLPAFLVWLCKLTWGTVSSASRLASCI